MLSHFFKKFGLGTNSLYTNKLPFFGRVELPLARCVLENLINIILNDDGPQPVINSKTTKMSPLLYQREERSSVVQFLVDLVEQILLSTVR